MSFDRIVNPLAFGFLYTLRFSLHYNSLKIRATSAFIFHLRFVFCISARIPNDIIIPILCAKLFLPVLDTSLVKFMRLANLHLFYHGGFLIHNTKAIGAPYIAA